MYAAFVYSCYGCIHVHAHMHVSRAVHNLTLENLASAAQNKSIVYATDVDAIHCVCFSSCYRKL